MASPLRFRVDQTTWSIDRVRNELVGPLDDSFGATLASPRYELSAAWTARRLEMDNGDRALFAWRTDDPVAYWIGNTETPSVLWRTEKEDWEAVPYELARWARRELLAEFYEEDPWFESYPHLSWFFLPVLMSKDGRETTREFLREHAAGFPDATAEEGVSFYESFLSTGALDDHRAVMAGKLGTSSQLDLTRMRAAMGEFTVAKVLFEAGLDPTPEVDVETGHTLDFRTADETLVEVVRPQPLSRRSAAGTPAGAIRETAASKATGQLEHYGDALLVVDCSSFPDDEWDALASEQPPLDHHPAVVIRARPTGTIEGYELGDGPIDLSDAVELVA